MTLLVAPTLTSQVRDLVYNLGLQTQAAAAPAYRVVRQVPSRAIGTIYTNTGSQVAFVYASLVTGTAPTTSYLYIGGATVAQGKHATVGQSVFMAGAVNPGELYYASSTASNVTVLSWAEYGL
jgi:hypothetical protein